MKIQYTQEFLDFIKSLKDPLGSKAIQARLHRIANNNLGDFKLLKGTDIPLIEFRIHCHAGYRLYAYKDHDILIIMLCAGNKSTQNKDIKLADKIAKEVLNVS